MHYGDKHQREKASLKVVVYNHEVLGSEETQLMLTSIQKCKIFDPAIVYRMIKNPKKFFSKFEETKSIHTEKFVLIDIGLDEESKMFIREIKDVSQNDNDTLRLH